MFKFCFFLLYFGLTNSFSWEKGRSENAAAKLRINPELCDFMQSAINIHYVIDYVLL